MISNMAVTHDKQSHRRASLFSEDAFPADAPELVSALQTITQTASALLAVRFCAVSLSAIADTELLVFSLQPAATDGPSHGVWQASADTIEGCILHQGEPVLVADTHQMQPHRLSSVLQQTTGGAADEGSLLCVPLMQADQDGVKRCFGTLTLYAPEPHYFTSEHLHLCTLLADQSSLTLCSVQQTLLASAKLAQRERAQARFISQLAHELRAPLNSINGYLDITLEGVGGELNAEQHEFVQRARAGSEQLYALLEDLLLVARTDAGHLRLNAEIVSPGEIIRNAVEELELLARDHAITIDVQVPEQLPRLYGDAVRLQQVLRNLLSNALHFTAPDGRVSVMATVERSASCHAVSLSDGAAVDDEGTSSVLVLRVTDSGCGIAPVYHQCIFERYFQVPCDDGGRSGGQGLGLFIVKLLVELHGGTVEVESEPGLGSSFICRLPCLLS